MSKLFEIPKKKTPEISSNDLSFRRYLNIHFEKIKKVEDIIRKPEKGEIVFLQTAKAFNAFTFIPFVASVEPIKELSAVTYSINPDVINALVHLHDTGAIERIKLLVSESIIKRSPKIADHLHSVAKSRANFDVYYSWTHAKVCLLETHHNKYIIEGSGNWSANAHFEQYVWVNSDEAFDFRKEIFGDEKIVMK